MKKPPGKEGGFRSKSYDVKLLCLFCFFVQLIADAELHGPVEKSCFTPVEADILGTVEISQIKAPFLSPVANPCGIKKVEIFYVISNGFGGSASLPGANQNVSFSSGNQIE